MSRDITLTGYAVIVVAMVACEIAARRTGRIATLDAVLTAVLKFRPVLWLACAGWLWLGWHLFVRVRR